MNLKDKTMKTVILDGYTISRDDLNWSSLIKFGKLVFFQRTEPEEVVTRIGDAEAVLTSKCVIDQNVINRCFHLRYIGVLATGYNNVDTVYARRKNIIVTNIPYYSGSSVAQMTFSLLLETANHAWVHNISVHRGDWAESEDFCYTLTEQTRLAGKTIGIIGFGNIGRQVAQIAEAFGMKVICYTTHPPAGRISLIEQELVRFVEFTSLDSVLRRSDIITLHCPLKDETRDLISRNSIYKMKDGVVLINTARGPLVNEADLADALKSGKIRAAGLDVLSVEPPSPDNPLLGLRNCIITPHIGWITKEARARLIEIATLNIEAFLRGDSLNRVV